MDAYRDMDPSEKINPFIAFMEFLDGEREAVARTAEAQAKQKNRVGTSEEGVMGIMQTNVAPASITNVLFHRTERTLLITLR